MPLPAVLQPHPTRLQVRSAAHRFGLGSAGGPSGLSPTHLRDALSVPGTALLDTLTSTMAWIYDEFPGPLLFGARLVALRKPATSAAASATATLPPLGPPQYPTGGLWRDSPPIGSKLPR